MARTSSTMLPLGAPAPDFALLDPQGQRHALPDFHAAKALVVMFICNHCPFVKHVAAEIARVAQDYQPRGVAFVAIQSNDAEQYPDDAPARMADEIKLRGYTFPYVSDPTQAVAKAYRAACTPDFFVFAADRRLVYRGQLDASRPDNGQPVTGADLRAALDAVLAGQPVAAEQLPSLGCNIKWRPGNEPEYFG